MSARRALLEVPPQASRSDDEDDDDDDSSDDEDFDPTKHGDGEDSADADARGTKAAAARAQDVRTTRLPPKRGGIGHGAAAGGLVFEESDDEGGEKQTHASPEPKLQALDKNGDTSNDVPEKNNADTVKVGDSLSEPAASRTGTHAQDPKAAHGSVDALWEELNKPIRKTKPPSRPMSKKVPQVGAALSAWMSAPTTMHAAESAPVGRADDAPSAPVGGTESAASKSVPAGSSGNDLGAILGGLKKRKESIVSQTKRDWMTFKDEHGLHDELDAHAKDKNRYTDKVSFLARTDLREHEHEVASKHRRK